MTPTLRKRLRKYVGSLILDLPQCVWALYRRGKWVGVRNRDDKLVWAPDGRSVLYEAPASSSLHVCDVFPCMGRDLMRKALAEWPVDLEPAPISPGRPCITFIVPHRGADREAVLGVVLRSILAQRGVPVECILVEQSGARELGSLPDGVRHIHLPHPADPQPWRKAWAFNVGARMAKAPILVLQDGDIPVPREYAREILSQMDDPSHDALWLQRFLFYLSKKDTLRIIRSGRIGFAWAPEQVRQGWQGGTLAIRKDAFFRIGGMDETFMGWTGEDREFYDRALLLRGVRCGRIPFVHLWHSPQPTKMGSLREENLQYYRQVMAVPRAERVARLAVRQERLTRHGGEQRYI